MKMFFKSLLHFIMYIACGVLCSWIFKTPDAFLTGFTGSLATDFLIYRYRERDDE